jgi:hypothetical protein
MISANSVCRGAFAIVVTLFAAACGATVSPATQTPAPGATSTAVTPQGPYATQLAGEEATVSSRATASPFPSAAPAVVATGQPSTSTVHRGGLTLQVRLPKNTYLLDEAGRAELTLSNAGPETVFVQGDLSPFWIEPAPWPWQPPVYTRPPILLTLAPGQSITGSLVFLAHAAGLGLSAGVSFSRPATANLDGPDNIWLPLESGPIPLQVLPAAASQQLVAEVQVDRAGWRVRVTDAAGQAPAGPLVGLLEYATTNSYGSRPLDDAPGGVWAAAWDQNDIGPGQFEVRVWVGAPGYAIATARQSVAGPGAPVTMFDSSP